MMTQQDFRPLANNVGSKNPLIEEDGTLELFAPSELEASWKPFNKQLGDVTVEDFVLIIPLNEIIELCMHNRNEIITESVYKVLDELMKVYRLEKHNTIQEMNEAYFIRLFTQSTTS